MGNASSRASAGAKPIDQLDALRDSRDEYFASIEAALERGEISGDRAYTLLAERARQRPDEAEDVLTACRDAERMATLPRICALLNERADDVSSLISSLSRAEDNNGRSVASASFATAASDISFERASDADVKRYAKYKARDKLKFTEALEKDMQSGALSAGAALDLAERFVAKYPSTDKWMWAVCDSQDEEDFPLFCRVVEAHRRRCDERAEFARNLLGSLGEREQAAESAVESLEQSVRDAREAAKAEQKRLRDAVKAQEALLREARDKEKALEDEQALAQARLEMAEEDCSKRLERTLEDQSVAEERAERAQADCDKRAKKIESMREKVDKQRRALEDALKALREAETDAGDDCDEAMRRRARAAELKQRAEQLRAEQQESIAEESAPEQDQEEEEPTPTEDAEEERLTAADILLAAESQELRDRALNAKVVLPAHNPYSTYSTADDPDDFVAPGGVFRSAGAAASTYEHDQYTQKPYSRSLISRPTSEQYLALYHDLLSQSPWSGQFEGSEERKYNLMRELERKYMGGSKSTMSAKQLAESVAEQIYGAYDDASKKKSGDCYSLPFDFTPFGTTQVYRNWPANRPVRTKSGKCKPVLPDEAWLRSKVSTENMPFDVRWYDADLYFAHASLPRLLRMQMGKHVQRLKAQGGDKAVGRFRESVLRALWDKEGKKDSVDWQQLAVDYILLALRPSPEEPTSDARGLRSMQRNLFAEGDYLGAIRNKKRTIAYYAVLIFERFVTYSDLLVLERFPSVEQFINAVTTFTEIMSSVYRMVSAIPETQAVTLEQQQDRDAFINEIGKFIMHKSKKFEETAVIDFFDVSRGSQLGKQQTTEVFAIEALRWTLYFLADEGDNECALKIPYNCLKAALLKLVGRKRQWYVLDANVGRNFAIVNFNALMACSLDNIETDDSLLSDSFSGDLLDKQIKQRTEFACSRRTNKPRKAPEPSTRLQYEDLTMSERKEVAKTSKLPPPPPPPTRLPPPPPPPIQYETLPPDAKGDEQKSALEKQQRALERITGGVDLTSKQREHMGRLMREGKLDPCKRDLCAAGIVDKKTYRKWLLRAHPDKGGNTETFQRMMECLNAEADDESDRTYCPAFGAPEPASETEESQSEIEEEPREIESAAETSDDEEAFALGSMLAAMRTQRAAEQKKQPTLKALPAPLPAAKRSKKAQKRADSESEEDERPMLRSIEEQQGLSPEKVLAWRRMRLLENLKVLRGESGDEGSKIALDEASAINLQERKELTDLSRKYPDLQKLLKYSATYAELRRLQRDAYDDEAAERQYEQERERVFKIDQAQQVGSMLLALLDAEEKWLDDGSVARCSSIVGSDASRQSCRASGCRLSAGTYSETYNRCYDPELQSERNLGLAKVVEDRLANV